MNDRNIRRSERVTRVQTFGRDRVTDFAPGGKAAGLFQELDPIAAALEAARVGKQEVIEALNEDFRDIARTARAIALDDPAFSADPYRNPRTTVETPVATHADSLLLLLEDQPADPAPAKAAKAALRAKFTAYELPADFVADLRADRDALTACNSGKHSDNQEGVESTAAIDDLLAQAQSVITRLDAAVKNRYARDPEKLAAWKSASHTVKQEKRLQPPVKPTPPTA